jgi:hypothetical protein
MVQSARPPRVVAVLNSNDDLVRLIRETLHDEGYWPAIRRCGSAR